MSVANGSEGTGAYAAINPSAKEGFAMIKGRDFDHIVSKVPVYLGRKHQSTKPLTQGQFFAVSEKKNISRKHLKITFERDGPGPDQCNWYLYCFGKNGITVDGEFLSPTQNPWQEMELLDTKPQQCCRIMIGDKTRIQAGDSVFYFLLPDEYM